MTSDKKLTVVSWDARYREDVESPLLCLEKQTVRDQVDFVHIEWTKKANPEIEKHDFIKTICLNLPKPKAYPAFDVGLMWNAGLMFAETPWVSYFQYDIVPRDHYEKMLKILDTIPQKILYVEGWLVNSKDPKLAARIKEYKKLKQTLQDDLDLLPYKYPELSSHSKKATVNGVSCTVKKDEFIKSSGGWFWNVPARSEHWNGSGHKQPGYGGESLRGYLLKKRQAICAHKDIVEFAIPHPVPPRKTRITNKKFVKGGLKKYPQFLNWWRKR